MPSLNFKGKALVQNFHLLVPFHELKPVKAKSLTNKPSLHDNLVAPQSSPELPGARWIAVPGVGHNAMHYSRRFQQLLETELARLRASTSESPG